MALIQTIAESLQTMSISSDSCSLNLVLLLLYFPMVLSLPVVFVLLLLVALCVFVYRKVYLVIPSQAELIKRFSSKVVWITGASSGIGEALALKFAECGALLILSGRDETALKRVQQQCLQRHKQVIKLDSGGGGVVILPFDLSTIADPAQENTLQGIVTRALAAHQGRLDILVNNAGMSVRGSVLDTKLTVDRQLMDVNYFSAVALTRAALPHMTSAKSRANRFPNPAAVMVISSVQGLFSLGNRSAYCASKQALHGFFESLRLEIDPKQLHVCMICPGYVATNISKNALAGNGSKYGISDAANAQGLKPDVVAETCLAALYHETPYLVVAEPKIHLAVYLRWFAPALLDRLLRKRVQQENQQLKKA